MDDRKRQRELKDARYRDWQARKRSPGDLVTWAVVLGGTICVMLFLCSAYARNTTLGVAVLVVIISWLLVTWVIGGVNVISVLWGRTVSPDFNVERTPLVLLSTGILALIAVAFPVLDLLSTLDFGWYGVASGVIGLACIATLVIGTSRR